MAIAHCLDGRGVESSDSVRTAAVHFNSSEATMTETSKTISDDFSSCDDNAPLSPAKIPTDIRKLPTDSEAAVYAPTSDKKPIANPDPLQRREPESVALQPSTSDDGEKLFSERSSRRLH
jgi:hypothetical protein